MRGIRIRIRTTPGGDEKRGEHAQDVEGKDESVQAADAPQNQARDSCPQRSFGDAQAERHAGEDEPDRFAGEGPEGGFKREYVQDREQDNQQ